MSDVYPGKRSFFKYVAPETALSVLMSRSVRYSSPLTFNDPFDTQSGLHFDFDLDTLHQKILDKMEEFATAPETPPIDANDPWGQTTLFLREKYPTHGFPRDGLRQVMAPVMAWLVQVIRTTQKGYQQFWWETLMSGLRVFCVSEERDSLLMWAHYAKDHTGAVFEFLSLPDEDNPLSVARPVTYVDQPPPFFTEAEWLDEALSIKKFDPSDLYTRYVHVKSKHWQYEREWRVWYPIIPAPPGILYVDNPLRQSEFAAVYIGCRAESSFVSDVVSLTRSAFPSTRIYRAQKCETAYSLEYMEI